MTQSYVGTFTAIFLAITSLGTAHEHIYEPFWPLESISPSFDFYILAQSWQPEFCYHHYKEFPGCQSPNSYWTSHFTIHGLWPETEIKGKSPSFCQGAEPFRASVLEDVVGFQTLQKYWPDVKFPATSPDYPDFWKHEWIRHGTCSSLPLTKYFNMPISLIQTKAKTPDLISNSIGKPLLLRNIKNAYAIKGDSETAVVLKCVSKRRGGYREYGELYLSQVFTCWSKNDSNEVTERRSCPSHILSEDTCGDSENQRIWIPEFPQVHSSDEY